MILRELKEWIDSLPEEFLDCSIVNGEEGKLDDKFWYRLDKPIVSLMFDEESNEIVFLNEPDHELTQEEIDKEDDE